MILEYGRDHPGERPGPAVLLHAYKKEMQQEGRVERTCQKVKFNKMQVEKELERRTQGPNWSRLPSQHSSDVVGDEVRILGGGRGFQPGHAGENCNHLCSPGVIYALGNGVGRSNITRFLGVRCLWSF